MIIDVHAHAIVPTALEAMASAHPDYGPELAETGGRRYLHYPGRPNLGPLPDAIFEPELRRRDMERQRVERQVVAVPPPNFHYHVPSRVGVDFARIQNDALLELSDSAPELFHVFTILPLQDVDASLRELERVAGFAAVRGVEMGTNIDGTNLDDPGLDPVWEGLQSLDLPVWLHPDQRAVAGRDRLDGFYMPNLVGLPWESTIAAARLIFGGVMDRYPRLRIGFVHGGGYAPYQVGRWDHGWSVREEPRTRIDSHPPSHYFGMFFFDTLTHDPASLRLLGERVGWDHVMLGSDYPFDMSAPDPVGAVEEIDLAPADLRAVLEGNAGSFLRPMAGE